MVVGRQIGEESDDGGVGRQKWWQIGEESGDGRGDRGGSRYRR
jgi:hypothetical protein